MLTMYQQFGKNNSELINMKIVSLYGRGNIGKTTTLKKLLVKILRSLPSRDAVLKTSLHGKTIDEKIAEAFVHDTNECVIDCYAVVEINGRKIGLTTYGDNDSSMEEHFEKFADCDLCFCATRTYGSSCDFVYAKAGADNVYWYRQTYVTANDEVDLDDRRNAANESMADLLYKEFDNFIK